MLLPELAPDHLPPEAAEWRKAIGTLRPSSSPCRYLGASAWANDAFIRNYNLGTCILGACIAPQMRSERSLEQISRQSLDHISFRVFLSGTSDLQVDGRSFELKPGDLQVLDMSQWMRSNSHGSKPVIH